MMGKIDIHPLLDPEMAAAVAESQRLYAELGPVAADDPIALRAAYAHERAFWNAIKPELASIENLSIPGPGGPLACRLYKPSRASRLPALVYFHGGGWALGNLDTHDRIMRLLALKSGAAVIGVDYRLAPEHKFPAAWDDALASLRHVAEQSSALGIDPRRLAVGGDSAGANLSVATCLILGAAERATVKIQLLYYGVFGLTDSASARAFGNDTDGLTRTAMDRYRDWLRRDASDLADPRFDNLSAELRGLPPAFIAASALDPLLDDSRSLAQLLTGAGVANELVVYEGVLHGFLHYSRMVGKAMQALDAGAAALKRAFG
jgi:acetyl esterase